MGVLRVKVNGVWVDVGTSMPAFGRNLIDNGQLAVKQRLATSVVPGAPSILADRWSIFNSGVGVANLLYATTTAFVVPLPVGRPRPANIQYLQMTTAEAAGSLSATDFMQWSQYIEGQFVQQLNWGTPDAQPVTYSFDIYSSIATTYVVELYRPETTVRSISKAIIVPAGWSTQAITFPGDLTTVITNDNVARLIATVGIGSGSNQTSGTLQTSWGNVTPANRWAGLSNAFAATVGNIFAITNAQLEVGGQATPYEVRDYAQEMFKCRRYFRHFDSSAAIYTRFQSGYNTGAGAAQYYLPFSPPMRATPTGTSSAAATFIVASVAGNIVLTSLAIDTAGSSPEGVNLSVGVASGLTTGQGSHLCANNTTSAYLEFMAEI